MYVARNFWGVQIFMDNWMLFHKTSSQGCLVLLDCPGWTALYCCLLISLEVLLSLYPPSSNTRAVCFEDVGFGCIDRFWMVHPSLNRPSTSPSIHYFNRRSKCTVCSFAFDMGWDFWSRSTRKTIAVCSATLSSADTSAYAWSIRLSSQRFSCRTWRDLEQILLPMNYRSFELLKWKFHL